MRAKYLKRLEGKEVFILINGESISGILTHPRCPDTDLRMWALVEDTPSSISQGMYVRTATHFKRRRVSAIYEVPEYRTGELEYQTQSRLSMMVDVATDKFLKDGLTEDG